MDIEVAKAPAMRQEGDTIVVPVVEPVLVVARRLRPREEVRLHRVPTREEVHRLPGKPPTDDPTPSRAGTAHQENHE